MTKNTIIKFVEEQAPIFIAFLIPIKLIFTYIFLFPSITWLIYRAYTGKTKICRSALQIAIPLFFFVLVGMVTASFGLDVGRSFYKLPRLAFYLCTVMVICEYCCKHGLLKPALTMLIGQGVASSYSVLEAGLPFALPQLFLGTVTESGQLAIATILACGLIVYLANQLNFPPEVPLARAKWHKVLLLSVSCGIVAFILAIIFAFGETFLASKTTVILSGSLFYLILALAIFYNLRIWQQSPWDKTAMFVVLVSTILPLLVTALLVNMKRGPWSGVFIATLLLLILYAKRTVLPVLVIVLAVLITVGPVRDRLLASSEHFFIQGGRNEIWAIGAELAVRYPLGIGHANSRVLTEYSGAIPSELNHFHNNLIQVAVENGWLGLAIFCWWILVILKMALSSKGNWEQTLLARTFGCAILAWQIAGLVEYNFGDSQVLFSAFLVMGLLAANNEKCDILSAV